MLPAVKTYIEKYNLQRHPEGGYFSETYRSADHVAPKHERYQNEERTAGTSIYYLLEGNDFSAFHKIKSDEIWHFYDGCDVEIYVIDPTGKLNSYLLGCGLNAHFQVVIPAGYWFAAKPIDSLSFSFVGCTVHPGFEFRDFILAEQQVFLSQYPQYKELILKFTR